VRMRNRRLLRCLGFEAVAGGEPSVTMSLRMWCRVLFHRINIRGWL
jgi:hypothetical protein